MGRPVKWSRDLYSIRERAAHDKTETWSRRDIERLFNVGRATAQSLMKAIGEVQPVAGAHFVERSSILGFLDEMTAAPNLEVALRERLLQAPAPPRPKALRVTLPADLRTATMMDLPSGVRLSPGKLEITADSFEGIVQNLLVLAQVLQNDMAGVQLALEPPPSPPPVPDDELQALLRAMRESRS